MFYSIKEHNWLKSFENNFSIIQEELKLILNKPLKNIHESTWAGERPDYLTSSYDNSKAWKTYTFKFFGIKHLPNYESCPYLSELIERFPQIITAEFSMLEPDTHILPHRGFTNLVLRSHLGMIIPDEEAAIRVGKETKQWKKGEFLIFDDSIDHEAWNKTSERRIVLMIDFVPEKSLLSGKDVAEKILSETTDNHVLNIAPRETWLEWLEKGYFPIEI